MRDPKARPSREPARCQRFLTTACTLYSPSYRANQQLRTQFLSGLRDPIKRFTLSRYPKTLEEAVDAAVREERSERVVHCCHALLRSVKEGDRETDELRARLERVERLLEAGIELQNKHKRELDSRKGNAPRRGECYDLRKYRHFSRNCQERGRAKGNTGGWGPKT